MKKRIKILSSTIALASIGISASASATLISASTSDKNLSITNDSSTRNDDKSALVPAQANGQNAKHINKCWSDNI